MHHIISETLNSEHRNFEMKALQTEVSALETKSFNIDLFLLRASETDPLRIEPLNISLFLSEASETDPFKMGPLNIDSFPSRASETDSFEVEPLDTGLFLSKVLVPSLYFDPPLSQQFTPASEAIPVC